MLKRKPSAYFLLYALLYGIAVFFLFYNLSDRLMWGDEAETAILARNILKFGVPIVDDGKNFLTQYPEPWESNAKKVWTWNTWLSYYLTACSFRVLGENTLAARLPFAIIAFFTVVLMRRVTLTFYEDEGTAFIATLLLAASVPFLLHVRQCRYYSILAFGTLWMLVGYGQLAFEGKKRGGVSVALALIVLFYSSFVSFVGNFAALGLHSLLVSRKNPKFLPRIIPYYIFSVLAIVPWALYSGMLNKGGSIKVAGAFGVFLQYISSINFQVFPLALLVIPPISLLVRRVPWSQWIPSEKTSLLLLVVFGQLLTLSVFPFVYFRYLITVLPVLLILASHILRGCISARFIRYPLVAVLATTNLLGIASLYPYRDFRVVSSPIFDYIRGITNTYEDEFKDVLAFLKTNATETESVALLDPGYPFMFYTNMKVIDARYPRNYESIFTADWILTESPSRIIRYPNMLLEVPKAYLPLYQKYELTVRYTPLGASRPDPDFYCGLSSDTFKKLVIYRRLKPYEKSR